MAFTTVPTVVDGDDIVDDWGNAVAASSSEVQGVLGDETGDMTLVRWRGSRTALTYGSGLQIINATTTVEDVGGITNNGDGTYTVPSTGSYAVTVRFNAATAPGADSAIRVSVAGNGHNLVIANKAFAAGVSITLRVAATGAIALDSNLASATIADINVEIVKVSRA